MTAGSTTIGICVVVEVIGRCVEAGVVGEGVTGGKVFTKVVE